jgi:transcriptional regulator with XRE-family HTH domain
MKALGAALRERRLARGMSLRQLARLVGLSGHGTLVDYELGRRLVPEDLLIACERVLAVPDGYLLALRREALAARGAREAAALMDEAGDHDDGRAAEAADDTGDIPDTDTDTDTDVDSVDAPDDRDRVEAVARPWRRRAHVLGVAVLAVALLGLGLKADEVSGLVKGAAAFAADPCSASLPGQRVRFGFERPSERWSIFWAPKQGGAKVEVTDGIHYQGTHALLVTITVASTTGYVAVGTDHCLAGLRPGMKVTMYLWTQRPNATGVRFFAMNSASKTVWARETAETEVPLTSSDWSAFTWTVPSSVDKVHAIGMQIFSEDSDPLLIGMDSVSW